MMHSAWSHRIFYLNTGPFDCVFIGRVGLDGDRERADAQQQQNGGKRVLTRHGNSNVKTTGCYFTDPC